MARVVIAALGLTVLLGSLWLVIGILGDSVGPRPQPAADRSLSQSPSATISFVSESHQHITGSGLIRDQLVPTLLFTIIMQVNLNPSELTEPAVVNVCSGGYTDSELDLTIEGGCVDPLIIEPHQESIRFELQYKVTGTFRSDMYIGQPQPPESTGVLRNADTTSARTTVEFTYKGRTQTSYLMFFLERVQFGDDRMTLVQPHL